MCAHAVADGAPGAGWGKAIGEIKELQREWQEIGHVPRRDADAVYKAFRAACDALFVKRDEARDAEANQHREQIEEIKAEIADVIVGGDDVVAQAVAVRTKARELDSRELAAAIERMIRHVVTAHPEAVKGTELDPAAIRARREKLIGKATELLPKAPANVSAEGQPADIAAQLKQAMRSNAFGDLRFSGRDPVEVIDELRAQWAEAGPILDDEDRAQAARFDEVCTRVLDATGAARGDDDRGRRRRRDANRGERRSLQPVAETTPVEPAATAAAVTAAATPVSVHDAVTQPAQLPFEPLPAPPVPEPVRAKPKSTAPPMEEIDTGWDLGEDDPTAAPEPAPPSASEMAGDSATGGDGIDEPGWD